MDAWYLKEYILTPGANIPHFIILNTHHLLTFLLPGSAAALMSALAILVVLATAARRRYLPPVALMACASCGIVLLCSLLRLYPYGGIRQCLYLSPVLCLLASISLVQVTNNISGRAQSMAFVGIVGVVVASGAYQILLLKPYAEVEDIQRVLVTLDSLLQPAILSPYIYPGAVSAVDFYVKERDPRFLYGDYHRHDPERYASDVLATSGPEMGRLWIVSAISIAMRINAFFAT